MLNSEKIEYLVVGGYAVSYHGYPRPTGDLDVWVATAPQSASKLATVVAKFGFAEAGSAPELFLTPGNVVRMGVPPIRIEIINKISGVDFSLCYSRRIETTLDGVPVKLIHRDDLLANKRAAARDKDLNDVKQLEKRGVC